VAKSTQKTVAIKLLEGKKIPFEQFSYPSEQKDAVLVAEAIGHDPAQVFKTLVVQPPDDSPKSKWSLVIIPADKQLDLKKLAKGMGEKKVKMATHAQAEQVTKLQVGGISALALLNKGFRVYLEQSAQQFEQIVISAGQRGMQVKLAVSDLATLTRANFIDTAV
jgi:Cys-tRNA(Pro)/Cys-tRNA(Cys) deacylase